MIVEIDLTSYEPYPKNPKIAKVFKEIGLADELGSGVRNIYKYIQVEFLYLKKMIFLEQ